MNPKSLVDYYREHERSIFGRASSFYNKIADVQLSLQRSPEPTVTPENTIKGVLWHFERTGDKQPLLRFIYAADLQQLADLLKEWRAWYFKRPVFDTELIDLLYRFLATPALLEPCVRLLVKLKPMGYANRLLHAWLEDRQQWLECGCESAIQWAMDRFERFPLADIERLEALLQQKDLKRNERENILYVLSNLEGPPRRRLADLFMREWADREINFEDDETRFLLKTLAHYADERHANWMEAALRKAVDAYRNEHHDYAYEQFMRGYARAAGRDALPYLRELFVDVVFFRDACKAIAIAAAGSNDVELVDWMRVYSSGSSDAELGLYLASKAAHRILDADHWQRYSETLPDSIVLQIENEARPLFEIAIELRNMGLIDEDIPLGTLIERSSAEYEPSMQDHILSWLRDAGVCYGYDTETGGYPIRYDNHIQDFAGRSRGLFRPFLIEQTLDEAYHVTEVRFDQGAFRYVFQPEHNEDWVDANQLVAAVNLALIIAGSEHYFIPFAGSGQFAGYLFTTPEKALKLHQQWGFRLR